MMYCSPRLLRRAVMIFQQYSFVCGLISSCLMLTIASDDQSSPIEQSYLLLRNGNVLKGAVRSEKERISIAVDGNSNLFIDPKQVSFVGPTLESLYQNQRSSVRQWGTGEHWQLAQWCIQQGLIDHAIEHYEVLETAASDSPKLKQLEHQLREALLANETVKQVQKRTQAVATAAPPSETNQVVLAYAKAPKSETNVSSVPLDPADAWNKHEIPSYVRKTFQNSILPILVSRCGQSGCHGSLGKSEFHVYQPLGEQAANTLARDLDEVLRYVDRDQTHQSSLIAYATKAHGIQRNPSLNSARGDERALIERINFWVKSLALSQKPETYMPEHYPSGSLGTSEVMPAAASMPVSKPLTRKSRHFEEVEQDRNAKLSKPAKSAPPTEFLSMSEIAGLESAIQKFEKQVGTGSAGSSPPKKDPFDPDVFNRKFK